MKKFLVVWVENGQKICCMRKAACMEDVEKMFNRPVRIVEL